MDEVLAVVAYVAGWPRAFSAERDRSLPCSVGLALRIDHNGSTSVPGLAAKPKATRSQHALAWSGSSRRYTVASLSIRKLDEGTYDRLRRRASRHGTSMEEEARQILKRAVSQPERLGDLFLKIFGPARGTDVNLPPHEPHEPMNLE